MVEFNFEKDDLSNLIEFFDLAFFDHLKNLLELDQLDNMAYLKSMVDVYYAISTEYETMKSKEVFEKIIDE